MWGTYLRKFDREGEYLRKSKCEGHIWKKIEREGAYLRKSKCKGYICENLNLNLRDIFEKIWFVLWKNDSLHPGKRHGVLPIKTFSILIWWADIIWRFKLPHLVNDVLHLLQTNDKEDDLKEGFFTFAGNGDESKSSPDE